jgi:hypothetical protein
VKSAADCEELSVLEEVGCVVEVLAVEAEAAAGLELADWFESADEERTAELPAAAAAACSRREALAAPLAEQLPVLERELLVDEVLAALADSLAAELDAWRLDELPVLVVLRSK